MEKVKRGFNKVYNKTLIFDFIIAFLLNLIIESLARQGIVAGVTFIFTSPLVFFYNVVLIFATLSITIFFRRRVFVLSIVSLLWLALGVTNGIILANRMTPFTVYDLQSVKDGLSLATNYLSKGTMIIGIVGVVVLVVAIVLLFKKAPKKKDKVNYKKNFVAFVLVCAATFGLTQLFIGTKVLDTYFPNLAYGYRDNGVPYCFVNTWLNTGVSKPDNYSKSEIRDIFTKKELETTVGKTKGESTDLKPNIIYIQLESLMDPLTLKDVSFDKDPIPNLRKLYETTSSGRLTVPALGAGTANTEFENMTGMSVHYFGPGEYPYKNIMLKETCESIPYNLKQIGYSTHAIHNHRGVFYGRNKVFPNLGFDTFTSLEYMNNVSKTPKNWAKDNVLTTQIMDALQSTKNQDYIYTISVQGHGKYPTEKVIENPAIQCTKAPTEELKWEWEYYANEIHEMDTFVKNFINTMKKFDEKTVVVMYGDHLPALSNISNGDLKDGRNEFQTDYFIWSNFKMEEKKEDLAAYQLGAELLKRLGIKNGTLTTFHQDHKDDKNYMQELHDLQYDMLYGKKYIYNGKSPWKPTDMKMGVKTIKIDKIVKIGDNYYIKGENFTEYSKVNLDGKILDTTYLGPTILALNEKVDVDAVKKMKVSQVESKNTILSTTDDIIE